MNRQIAQALVLAGSTLAGSIALTVARKTGIIDHETTTRALMVLIGLVMMITANDIPKSTTAKSARGQALQRLTGRAMVIAYLIWLAVWIFAPMNLANGLAMIPVLLAGAWIAVVCFRTRRTVA